MKKTLYLMQKEQTLIGRRILRRLIWVDINCQQKVSLFWDGRLKLLNNDVLVSS